LKEEPHYKALDAENGKMRKVRSCFIVEVDRPRHDLF
jgi:hypothetical protein